MKNLAWQERIPPIFNSPGFRWLWLATLVSKLGDWIGFIALNIYVFDMTKSATALAGVLAVQAVPSLLLGPFAGVIIDRFSRRRIMIIVNFIAAGVYLLLPLTTTLWQIYILALIARTTVSFFEPTQRSLAPDLVGKDKALEANSALTIIGHLTLIIGPAIAGILVASAGVAWAFWTDAASFLIAILFIARIQGEIPRTRIGEQTVSWLGDMKEGLQYALRYKALRVILITTFVSTIAGATLVTIEVVYVKDVLKGGDAGYATLYSVAGIGALIASVNVRRWVQRFSLTGLYVASVFLTGVTFFPYANTPILWMVIIIACFHTIPWVLGMILVDTMLQQWVADEVRGRIFSLIYTERSAGQVLVAAIFAPFIDLWGPVAILNIAGVIYTLIGIYAISQLGTLRLAGEGLVEAT